MSSHHIVREKQEPALIIENFNVLDRVQLDQLLEWSPTVIVDTYNIDFLLSEEIKVDILFGNEPDADFQLQIKVLPMEHGYLRSALSYLVSESYPAVNVLSDKLDPILSEYAPFINMVVFCDNRRYVFVRKQYEKWKPKGERIYVNPQELRAQEGLKHIEEDIFETLNDGIFKLILKTTGIICIGEDL